jgi:hypothetical protein
MDGLLPAMRVLEAETRGGEPHRPNSMPANPSELEMRDTGFPGVPRLSKGMYKKLHAFSKMQAKVDLFLPVASKRALLSC